MTQATHNRRPRSPARDRDVMNLAEAAKFLRLPPKAVERLVTEQGLPGRRIAKEWRFLRAAVERWLEPGRPPPGSILEQFGMFAGDPAFEEYLNQIEQNRKRWNEDAA